MRPDAGAERSTQERQKDGEKETREHRPYDIANSGSWMGSVLERDLSAPRRVSPAGGSTQLGRIRPSAEGLRAARSADGGRRWGRFGRSPTRTNTQASQFERWTVRGVPLTPVTSCLVPSLHVTTSVSSAVLGGSANQAWGALAER